jgi:hypothetical protein
VLPADGYIQHLLPFIWISPSTDAADYSQDLTRSFCSHHKHDWATKQHGREASATIESEERFPNFLAENRNRNGFATEKERNDHLSIHQGRLYYIATKSQPSTTKRQQLSTTTRWNWASHCSARLPIGQRSFLRACHERGDCQSLMIVMGARSHSRSRNLWSWTIAWMLSASGEERRRPKYGFLR